jgi:hypothetical protein
MGRTWIAALSLAASILLALPSAAPAARNTRVTELVSLLPNGSDANVCTPQTVRPSCPFHISRDGRRAFFVGKQIDIGQPFHGAQVYERSGATSTLISTGPAPSSSPITMCDHFTSEACSFDISADGSRVYFSTAQSLVNEDTDPCQESELPEYLGCNDVYERVGDTTRLVSTGATAANGPFDAVLAPTTFRYGLDGPTNAVIRSGRAAFFQTAEPLVAADTDTSTDVYESVGNTVKLFPSDVAAAGDTSPIRVHLEGASPDGSRVFFSTAQSFSPADTDNAVDIYERTPDGRIVLVSTGPNGGNGLWDAEFKGASADGSHVYFTTRDSLVPEDTDVCPNSPAPPIGCQDVYERDLRTGTTALVSTGPNGRNGASEADFDAATEDGRHVFFTTDEALLSLDGDSCPDYLGPGCLDVYERSSDDLRLVSTGPLARDAPSDASFGAISKDGKRVFFNTTEPLLATDTDSCPDAYATTRGCSDAYERSGTKTTLLSIGPSSANGLDDAGFIGASENGRRVFLDTTEALVETDTDSCPEYRPTRGCPDIYERVKGSTTLVSTGPSDPGGACDIYDEGEQNCPAALAISADGTRVFFGTGQALVPADTNTASDRHGYDVYVSVAKGNPLR